MAEQLGVPAFVVGGLVRDLLLGRKNFGVDVVIDGDGIAFSRALSRRVGARVTACWKRGYTVRSTPKQKRGN